MPYRPKATAYQASADDSTQDQENAGQQGPGNDSSAMEAYDESTEPAQDDTDYGNQTDYTEENYYDESQFAGFVGIEANCNNCSEWFPSKTRLHKHLRAGCKPTSEPSIVSESTSNTCLPVIESTAPSTDLGSGFAFRGWNFAEVNVKISPNADTTAVCLDTGCGVTLIDRQWLADLLPDLAIKRMSSPLRVRGVGTSKHETNEFAIVPVFLPGKKDGKQVLACIRREVHIVDDLRVKMLIGNDVIGPEGIVVDIANETARIGSCNTDIKINACQRGHYVKRTILAQSTTVPAHSEQILPVYDPILPADRDFFFEPAPQSQPLTLVAHLVDHRMSGVLARNETSHPITVPRKHKLGTVADIPSCYKLDIQPVKPATRSWFKTAIAATSALTAAFHAVIAPSKPATDVKRQEVKLANGIMVYGDPTEVSMLGELVNEFPTLWVDDGFANVPQDEWMKLTLRNDWQDKVSGKAKVYPLGIKDREVIDKTFDEMYEQGRLEWTTQVTPFSFPVFVVWKDLPGETGGPVNRKGRPVVDIRALNDLLVPDAHATPLQADIIASLQGCTHISVLDAASFFYQWRVYPDFRHMFTVVNPSRSGNVQRPGNGM